MAGNRAVLYMGPGRVEVQNLDDPQLASSDGRKCDHGVILEVVAANICCSDQHIYSGSVAAAKKSVLGHEITGNVVEVGRDVQHIKVGDLVSAPFTSPAGAAATAWPGSPEPA